MPLRTVVPYDPGPSVAELATRFGVDHLVKLNWNEDLFGLLPGVREAVIDELQRCLALSRAGLCRFPRGRRGLDRGARRLGGARPRDPVARAHGRDRVREPRGTCRDRGADLRLVPAGLRGVRRGPRRGADAAGSASTSRRWPRRRKAPSSYSSATRTTRPGTRWRRGSGAGSSRRCRTDVWSLSTRPTPITWRHTSGRNGYATSHRAGRSWCCARSPSCSASPACGSGTPSSTRRSSRASTPYRSRST